MRRALRQAFAFRAWRVLSGFSGDAEKRKRAKAATGASAAACGKANSAVAQAARQSKRRSGAGPIFINLRGCLDDRHFER
jgi:predicted Zn-dependent protease